MNIYLEFLLSMNLLTTEATKTLVLIIIILYKTCLCIKKNLLEITGKYWLEKDIEIVVNDNKKCRLSHTNNVLNV